MLDTIIVWLSVSPTPRQLCDWVSHPLIFPNGVRLPKYFQNAKLNYATITFVHYPPNPRYPNPWLSIQVSLPKVLFENNVQMITQKAQIDEAISLTQKFINNQRWLPELDLGAAILWQVDAAYNHQVGEDVQGYIRALFKLHYLKRKTEPYPHQGIQFRSDAAICKFYDKYKECTIPSAYGILRQEATLRHTPYLARQMKLKEPTVNDISIPWLCQVLQDDLRRLHLLQSVITDRSTAQYVLEQRYGWSMGSKLFSHLFARQSMSKEQMISNGKSERTIRDHEKLITDAGIALTLTDDGLQLPALDIRIVEGMDLPVCLNDT